MSGATDFFIKLQRNIRGLADELKRVAIQAEAEAFHAENFQREGFTDNTFKPWPPRKKADQRAGKRNLLVKSGKTRRWATDGKVVNNSIDFVFPAIYPKVHNEGLKAGRGKGFIMPKRQFIGKSRRLEDRIQRKAVIILNRRLNKL